MQKTEQIKCSSDSDDDGTFQKLRECVVKTAAALEEEKSLIERYRI